MGVLQQAERDRRHQRLRGLLAIGIFLSGCSAFAGFDNLVFDLVPDGATEIPDALREFAGADGGGGQDGFREEAATDAGLDSALEDATPPEDASVADVGVMPPPVPVPPPPPSPCFGARAHRVLYVTPGAVLEAGCPAATSPSLADTPEIELVSWELDAATCEFTRVRRADYGSSGWTSTETGIYTSALESEGEQSFTQWGSSSCTRRQLFHWRDVRE